MRFLRKLKICSRRDLLPGLLLGIALGWLCFRNIFGMAAGICILPIYSRFAEENRRQKCRKSMEKEFKDVMALLYSSTAAGNTIEKAFRDTVREMQRSDGRYRILLPEFVRICHGLEQNRPFDQLLDQFAGHMQNEDILQFVQVLKVARKSGGSMADIIQNSISTLTLRMEISEEIDVMISGKKGEFTVMMLIPAGIILYMNLFSADYMTTLYTTLPGRLVMMGAILVYIAAVWIGRKILDIRV